MSVIIALILTSLPGPVVAAIVSKWQRTIYGNTCVYSSYYFAGLIPVFGLFVVLINVFLNSSGSLKTELLNSNQLRECVSCGKYSRRYQRELEGIKVGNYRGVCPHDKCGEDWSDAVDEERKWLAVHRDCPRLSLFGFIRYRLAVNKIERINENIAEIDSYMAYEKARECSQ